MLNMPSPDRPLISFVLLAYNQEKFIREAVAGAFSQNYSPLEIILSDDCSPDPTFEIMQEMAAAYKGPHKIVLNRNERNLGIGQHFNRVMKLATGEIIVPAAGDDISLPSRTFDSWSILHNDPSLKGVSVSIHIFHNDPYRDFPSDNDHYELSRYDIHNYLNRDIPLYAASRAFHRHTHDYFGPMTPECPTDDTSVALRCLLHGTVAVCSKIGVLYRQHGDNSSRPDNLRRFSRRMIHKDYLNSISLAFKGGLISETIYRRLILHVAKLEYRHETLSELEQTKAKFKYYTTHMLFSRHFATREKLGYLRKLLHCLSTPKI
jgi:glycosyltransferase involved in cell wall biosynthesis